ncbi:hypothetical protein J7T55_011773 [Diaporthe amygdali]|uniref:uncharacterized protein n=1 Tax=Phomopsis amygdali TaxID=1214568 RepID=UPI0022FE1A2B|nr:uncharacterized protein J7T55_011773 [Diaporthe amygdali]KAJ0123308.1 hypothetical protein J7T55_011773 [Diaporthe amygdali]
MTKFGLKIKTKSEVSVAPLNNGNTTSEANIRDIQCRIKDLEDKVAQLELQRNCQHCQGAAGLESFSLCRYDGDGSSSRATTKDHADIAENNASRRGNKDEYRKIQEDMLLPEHHYDQQTTRERLAIRLIHESNSTPTTPHKRPIMCNTNTNARAPIASSTRVAATNYTCNNNSGGIVVNIPPRTNGDIYLYFYKPDSSSSALSTQETSARMKDLEDKMEDLQSSYRPCSCALSSPSLPGRRM